MIASSVSVCVLCTVLHRIDECVVVLEECSLHLCDVNSEHEEGDVDDASSEADGAYDAESVKGNVLEIERKCSPSHDHSLPTEVEMKLGFRVQVVAKVQSKSRSQPAQLEEQRCSGCVAWHGMQGPRLDADRITQYEQFMESSVRWLVAGCCKPRGLGVGLI